MTSSPAGGFSLRNNSRARRLARFLTTAEPSFRVAATPNRHRLPLFGATNRVMNRPRNRKPCSYARSNSGRFRTRSCRERRSVTGRCLCLPLVRDSQTFPALRAPSLQHDAAVLRRHSHTKAVRLAAATRVGLKRAPSFCHCDCVLHTNWSVESSSRETPNTSRRLSIVSKPEADQWRCATVRGRLGRRSVVCGHSSPFGFSPKISTPVENTVEKQVKWSSHRWKGLIFHGFRPGESP